jgi:hypothetical protein
MLLVKKIATSFFEMSPFGQKIHLISYLPVVAGESENMLQKKLFLAICRISVASRGHFETTLCTPPHCRPRKLTCGEAAISKVTSDTRNDSVTHSAPLPNDSGHLPCTKWTSLNITTHLQQRHFFGDK